MTIHLPIALSTQTRHMCLAFALAPAFAVASPTPELLLSDLLRRDGVFCAPAPGPENDLCDSVVRVTAGEGAQRWVSLTMLVRADSESPRMKLRLGHPATLEGEELCIVVKRDAIKLELFMSANDRASIDAEEAALDSVAVRYARKLQALLEGARNCSGLARPGWLNSWGKEPHQMRYVPLSESTGLRLRAP
ncbi:MAG: hypothetical protein QM740_21355 [Acidovorax sp.]